MQERDFSEEEVRLLARCAHALMQSDDGDKQEAQRFLACAAKAGDKESQLSWGLWLARMELSGHRNTSITGAANYKEAIRWLTLAGEQGLGKAWYAISRIYLKAEFSQRNVTESQHYLAKAAAAGYHLAQQELGVLTWRTRRGDASREVRAVYWLQKAAAQGCAEAATLLQKIASDAVPAPWAQAALGQLAQNVTRVPHVLRARVALAARIGLSIPEALLIDLNTADYGHCLVIDIRAHYARGKRRLILVRTEEERQAIAHIAYLLDGVDCGADGSEGNYRQRFYRFKQLVPNWIELQKLSLSKPTGR
jgi:uncharacterized protein